MNINKPSDESQKENQKENQTENKPYGNDMSHIKGWAVDANSDNDPTFPMRQRNNEDTKRYDWSRPSQQSSNVEILHSNERPNVTAVFGTSTPPTGLSGIIRRFAFRYSEGRILHWLSLLLADRINVAEGMATDLAKGHIPNVLNERGIKAEWRHNPEAVITKALIGVALIATVAAIVTRKSK